MSAPWNEPEAPYWSEVYADAYVDLLMAQEVPGVQTRDDALRDLRNISSDLNSYIEDLEAA